MSVEFTATFEEATQNINVDFETDNESVDVSAEDMGVTMLNNDHTQLENLDADDQHPISAIIGLEDELDDLETEPLTNMEIQAILNL